MSNRWIGSCGLGEAAGIAVVATVYAALDRGVLIADAPWILAAGAWEGLCLGSAQALVLARSGIARSRWIGVTVFGAVIGYGGSLLGGAGSGGEDQTEPALWLIAVLGAVMGLAMGAVLGGLQGVAARGTISAGRWIVLNMAGWAPAMAIIMLAASLVDRSIPLIGIAAVGALSGGLAGLALGAVTRRGLPRHG